MRVALLNSRKARRIDPDASWLRRTFALAAQVAQRGDILRGSIGSLPYEAALYGAARAGGAIEAVLPAGSLEADLQAVLPAVTSDAERRISWTTLPSGATGPERDKAVIDEADLAIAVAVRAGGQMERLLIDRWRSGGAVRVVADESRDSDTAGNRRLLAYGVPRLEDDGWEGGQGASQPVATGAFDVGEPLSAASPTLWATDPLPGATLAHYTRACEGPWPGQARRDYLEDLWTGGALARRDAGAALERILAMRRILGGARLIRGAYPVVSFTAVPPAEMAALHRYRRHLLRWDFEPFSLVFDREWLEGQGARAVQYLEPSQFSTLSLSDRPWFQKHVPPACDYQIEQEWRLLGDLDFSTAPREAVRLVRPG